MTMAMATKRSPSISGMKRPEVVSRENRARMRPAILELKECGPGRANMSFCDRINWSAATIIATGAVLSTFSAASITYRPQLGCACGEDCDHSSAVARVGAPANAFRLVRSRAQKVMTQKQTHK